MTQNIEITGPIAILDEHPEWSTRLIAEFDRRGLPWEKVDHSRHAYDPRDREPRFSVIVNRTSPSSATRGHGGVLFYAEPLLAHWEALGIPVINPVASWRFERSKALQAGLLERLGIRYPRALVVNHRDRVLAAADRLRFPIVVKPNVGGSGAGIVRFDSREELEARLPALDLGPDGIALVQEYIEATDGAIVRVEVLDGRYLYAIRIVRTADQFNLCPADICSDGSAAGSDRGWAGSTGRVEAAGNGVGRGSTAGRSTRPVEPAHPRPEPTSEPSLQICPVVPAPAVKISGYDAPAEAIDTAIRLTRAASIDVGGVEYLVSRNDGRIYFYDVNATSNFVANAPAVVGFDPFVPFVDYIASRRGGPRNAPPPRARQRPGEAVALLDFRRRGRLGPGAR